jgi:hypothetical protein
MLEVSNYSKEGDDITQLKLTNSLRNLLGPHHHKEGQFKGVSLVSFIVRIKNTDYYD